MKLWETEKRGTTSLGTLRHVTRIWRKCYMWLGSLQGPYPRRPSPPSTIQKWLASIKQFFPTLTVKVPSNTFKKMCWNVVIYFLSLPDLIFYRLWLGSGCRRRSYVNLSRLCTRGQSCPWSPSCPPWWCPAARQTISSAPFWHNREIYVEEVT